MDSHNQTHNDIKPQNFLVKFKNGQTDLTQIDIVLTDFGMAGPDSKGGTPIFASPECFGEKKSDIFSFGRVILFLLLTKNRFVKWLFVPIKDPTRLLSTRRLMFDAGGLCLVTEMTSIKNRIELEEARWMFDVFRDESNLFLNPELANKIDAAINAEMSKDNEDYVSELCDFR